MASDEMQVFTSPHYTATQRTLASMLPEARKVYGVNSGIVLLAEHALCYKDTEPYIDRLCTVVIEMLVDQLEEAF